MAREPIRLAISELSQTAHPEAVLLDLADHAQNHTRLRRRASQPYDVRPLAGVFDDPDQPSDPDLEESESLLSHTHVSVARHQKS